MNIDLGKAKEQFIQYTQKYDLENERLMAKQLHSVRVMKISKQIAQKLNLSQEEIDIATLIGLLHDIARFEQFTQYATYRDIDSIDHGDFGAKILEEDIRKYIKENKYDQIIIKAVKNHNKFMIEKELTDKEKLFAQIIRDADKIDIFYQGVVRFWKGREEKVENSKLSDDIIQRIREKKSIKRKKEETEIDNVITVIAFIFDLNFNASFQILKEENYINKILNRYKLKDEYTKEIVEEIKMITNSYIEEKIK